VANALGFSLCGLIAWRFVRPLARSLPPGVPLSRLSSRGWYAGPKYFEQINAVSTSKATPRGIVDDLEMYRRSDFDAGLIDGEVRAFYEQTVGYRLLVRPHWRRGFRTGGRIAHRLGTWIGQMRLPVETERMEDRIESRILPVEDSVDGRIGVRAWVRTYEGTDKAMYAAAYATHSIGGDTYMNIAFPVPGGNVSSILHMDYAGSDAAAASSARGLTLSTLARVRPGGDQGVYFANRLLPVRLPINETITVWPADSKDAPVEIVRSTEKVKLLARHEMWIFGMKFLELHYEIFPDEP
ncbi:MAG TPA: hypothetical protein VE842_02760, partial [Pyrinomonadaceae bacterium]|nr:hypothetical protein [Pyrinomonadaceae bacterium]